MRKFAMLAFVTVLMAVLITSTSPASAVRSGTTNRWWLYDYSPRDSRQGIDIDYSVLSVSTPHFYTVRFFGYEFTQERLNAAQVFLDVHKNNPGPEYVFTREFAADQDGERGQWASRLDSWNSGGKAVDCPKFSTSVNYGTDVITFYIPRHCVGAPARVRWNVMTWDITTYHPDGSWYGYYDADPQLYRFEYDYWVA
jgi:hypothetical protein